MLDVFFFLLCIYASYCICLLVMSFSKDYAKRVVIAYLVDNNAGSFVKFLTLIKVVY